MSTSPCIASWLGRVMLLMACTAMAATNVPPTVTIVSAAMRTNSTFMDVTYRITDPDDATVKVRALAFKDGTRSFVNVIRPVTWMEGTGTNIGDAITTGVNHTLTWDARADWDIDLGNVKFEVLCRDSRGLLPFEWLTIPPGLGKPQITISKNSPTSAQVLDALFWLYAAQDPGLTNASGSLCGTADSGVFNNFELASGASPQVYATPFVLKRMNLAVSSDVSHAQAARAGVLSSSDWYARNQPWDGIAPVVAWGITSGNQIYEYYGQTTAAAGLSGATALAAGQYHNLALKQDGTVVAWGITYGYRDFGQGRVPAGLSEVTAIAAGERHNLALKGDGTVVAWGDNGYGGQSTVPAGLSGVKAIAAGSYHNLALKQDGTVIGWGSNAYGESTAPPGLSGVKAIAAGQWISLALKQDGTVVGWGNECDGQCTVPAGLGGVKAIAAGGWKFLALKQDGTVVGWGYGVPPIPASATNVVAIAAGVSGSLALKQDGTVVAWGGESNAYERSTMPAGLSGVKAIAAGWYHSLALKEKAQ